jgi:hypothetical protein
MSPQETPEHGLTKSVWTEADFETMGWHDALLHSFTILPESFELVLDLDYITRWVRGREEAPDPSGNRRRRPPWLLPSVDHPDVLKVWVAPATMVFRGVQNISMALAIRDIDEIEILDLKRSPLPEKSTNWHWRFEVADGHLAFDAEGYTQYFRREPVFQPGRSLKERGGVSFARVAFAGAPQ